MLNSSPNKIIECLELEGVSRIIVFQSSRHGQGSQLLHQILDQIAQDPVQLGLEYFQEWYFYNISGQSVPAPHHTLSIKLPTDI